MLKCYQNKSEKTVKCKFLMKFRIEVPESWLDRVLKVTEITARNGGKYPKEVHFKQIF